MFFRMLKRVSIANETTIGTNHRCATQVSNRRRHLYWIEFLTLRNGLRRAIQSTQGVIELRTTSEHRGGKLYTFCSPCDTLSPNASMMAV